MQNFTLKRLESVIPILQDKFLRLRSDLLSRHRIEIEIVSAFRSHAEQTKLFNQGRTTAGKIVTKAKAGQSFHNFGLAIDVCHFRRGTFDWSEDNQIWLTIANCAKGNGLESGFFWKWQDKPHLQISGGLTLAEINAIFRVGGLKAVWRKVELLCEK